MSGAQALQATTIPVAPGTGTLAAAISGATAGDILELANGTYQEGVIPINKQLVIRAATGANPSVVISTPNITPGTGGFLIDITAAGVVWDGIDIMIDGSDPTAPFSHHAIYVRGGVSTQANPVTIQNCDITDGPNGPASTVNYIVVGVQTTDYLILNNVNMVIDDTVPQFALQAFYEPAVLELNNCDIRSRAGSSVTYSQSSASGTSPSTIIARDTRIAGAGPNGTGAAYLMNSIFSGNYDLENCTVIFDQKLGFRGILFQLTNNTGTFNADSTLFDGSTVTNGVFLFSSDSDLMHMNLTNCVIKYTSTIAPSGPLVFQSGGNVSMKHCTVTDVLPLQYASRVIMLNEFAKADAAGSLEVKNCLFNISDRPAAYLYDQTDSPGIDNNNITYDIGSNVIFSTVAHVQKPLADKISAGTPITSNDTPLLQADGIHLLAGTVAINSAPDIGVTTDYFGTSRPIGSAPDFGAVEADLLDPSAVNHWSTY